jgi:hypothetical protein
VDDEPVSPGLSIANIICITANHAEKEAAANTASSVCIVTKSQLYFNFPDISVILKDIDSQNC